MPLAPHPLRERRRRTAQHPRVHYASIALAGLLALGVGLWLVMIGRP